MPTDGFRSLVVDALEQAGIPWEMLLETENESAIHATVSADLAVHTATAGTKAQQFERIDHGGALPVLPVQMINPYSAAGEKTPPTEALIALLRAKLQGA